MIVPFLSFSVFPIWQKNYRGSSVSAEPGGPKQTPPTPHTNTSRREKFAGNPKSGSKKRCSSERPERPHICVPGAGNYVVERQKLPGTVWGSEKGQPFWSPARPYTHSKSGLASLVRRAPVKRAACTHGRRLPSNTDEGGAKFQPIRNPRNEIEVSGISARAHAYQTRAQTCASWLVRGPRRIKNGR